MSAEAAASEALTVPWSLPDGMPPFIDPAELPAETLIPKVPVDLLGPRATATGSAMIDPGSTMSTFPASVMPILGITEEMCVGAGTLEYGSIGPRPVLSYLDGLDVEIAGCWRVRLKPLHFMLVAQLPGGGLLGRDFIALGFRVTFDGVARLTIIEADPALAVPASELAAA